MYNFVLKYVKQEKLETFDQKVHTCINMNQRQRWDLQLTTFSFKSTCTISQATALKLPNVRYLHR